MGELVRLTHHKLVEAVAAIETPRTCNGLGDGRFSNFHGSFGLFRCRRFFHYFEIHRKGCVGASFEVGKDGVQVVVFEPFLLVTIGRSQMNATTFETHHLDGTQPLVALRWFDPLFNRSYGFAPKFLHVLFTASESKKDQQIRVLRHTSPQFANSSS